MFDLEHLRYNWNQADTSTTPRIGRKAIAHASESHPNDVLTTLPASATVHGLPTSNTFAVYGNGVDKELTELVPGILNQLGPDSLASLRKLAESYQAMNAQHAASQAAAGASKDDDDVPDVVENFDEADKKETEVDKLD
jgi:hypothetical protein